MRNEFIIFSAISLVLVIVLGFFWQPVWWIMIVLLPLVAIGFYDMLQSRHALMRNYPILGRGRWLMEKLRPKLQQYFVESDIDGRPFNRIQRSVVYQRAKKELNTTPFGTQLDVYETGYEWMHHSIAALNAHNLPAHPQIQVGTDLCKQPYMASVFNVSAMSFGALSINAILALNGGAKAGNFAHNTGEGGISPHHLQPGGDLIYQVGTGYFGSRAADGKFSPENFAKSAANPTVKMIELKLSQGAKPGHGGILPAKKNTPEIAKIRGVEPFTQVDSPPYHRAFSTPIGLLQLLQTMRQLSNGKPVGFKLCVGNKAEFIGICKAMIESKILPDFITVDGGEGGTGAAPLEFSDSVGMPFKEGLAFVHNCLVGFGLRQQIRVFASGKITTGFHIFKTIALGANACYSARAMMMALGCIQALECNKNTCPTGVATQDPELVKGLVVADKTMRIANYHAETLKSFVELMAAAGIDHPSKINRSHIFRRINQYEVRRYDEIFPYIPADCLLNANTVPQEWQHYWQVADANKF